MQRVFSSEGCADAMVAAGHAAEQESPTARTIRMVMEEAAARERERCAKIADMVAINAERRAAGHTNPEAIASAKDKQHAAEEVAAKIRDGANG